MAELKLAYATWYEKVSQNGFDPIPIPIGYPQRPVVTLPGHEAYLYPEIGQGISYVGRSGWANDWVTNWTNMDAYPYWEVEIVNDGTYELTIHYICAKEDVGAEFAIKVGGQTVKGKIKDPHNPEHIPSPDRVERKEVYEKEWQSLTVGKVGLKKGKTRLIVQALSKPGKTVMDLKAVTVRKIG
jgi:arylsulfatase A